MCQILTVFNLQFQQLSSFASNYFAHFSNLTDVLSVMFLHQAHRKGKYNTWTIRKCGRIPHLGSGGRRKINLRNRSNKCILLVCTAARHSFYFWLPSAECNFIPFITLHDTLPRTYCQVRNVAQRAFLQSEDVGAEVTFCA